MPDEINVTLEDESPVIEVQIIGTGPVGPTGGPGPAGPEGPAGSDGVSPEVTITAIPGGHRVTITDAEHPTGQSFDVMDGEGGGGAVSSVNGQTGAVVLTASDVGAGTYSRPSGGIPASDLAPGVIPSVPVQSVNGKTGAVVVDADDVGALPISATAEAEDSFRATRAYTTGELVVIAGGLYKVTAPVVAGDALVEGTNIRAVTLSQLLNDSAILLNPANGGIVPSSKMTLIPGSFFMNVKNGYVSLTMRIKVKETWTANQPNIVATLPQSTIEVIGQTSVATLCKIGDSQIGTVNINTWGGGNTISVTPPSVPAANTEINAAFITFPVT